jgi:tetratricopeptide (TPR) repeat protein
MKLSQARIAITLAVLVFFSSGCGLVNRIRAKNELNEAARAYRESNFVEAEQRSRRALELDPTNKTAPLFIARTIHAQYRPGVNTPQNLAKANEAIEAYKEILKNDPQNDEAYKAIAFLYERQKSEDQLRQWILARAGNDQIEPSKRAEAYVVLASKDWNCSFQITDLPTNKTTTVENAKATVSYKKPKEQKDFDTAQQCVRRGLEEVENAIKFDPNSESAWSYKTNLLLEAAKLAEMDGKTDQKAELEKQREAAQKRTETLSQENKKKKEAEEAAKKAASPPES